MRKLWIVCTLLSLSLPATAGIKFWTSELTLTLDHAATVKAPLEQLAFMQPQGPCSEPLTDALVTDFTGSGVTVVDGLHLKSPHS